MKLPQVEAPYSNYIASHRRNRAAAPFFVSVLIFSGVGATGFDEEGAPAQRQDLIIDQLERFAPQDAVSRNYRRGAWWWRENVPGAHGGTLLVTGQWRE